MKKWQILNGLVMRRTESSHKRILQWQTPLRILLLVAILVSCKEKPTDGVETQAKPNVLFIAVDDLNDWVGCLQGHPQVQTPNIDRLAASGTLFTNAHAQSPICNPSRTSVLTGLRPSTTGIYGLSPWIREVPDLQELVTLPQYFSQHGYETFSAGKLYHGGYGRDKSDTEFDSIGPRAGVKTSPPSKLAGETPGGNNPWVDWGSFPLEDSEMQDWEVASWAVEVLKSKPQAPYFLSVGFFLPHVPLYAPLSYFEKYPEETLVLPPMLENDRDDTPRASWYNHWDVPEPRWQWFKEQRQDTAFVRSYLAAISFMDTQVGRVLDALEENGQAENTIIVLWSDHGFHLGEKGISGKNTLWERSTRVPLIFAGKGVSTNQKSAEPVELLDIFPTLNALCGLPEKSNLEGHSLERQLEDPATRRPWPAITTNNQGNHAIRTNDWRYIRYADGSEELYHTEVDPHEWANLIGNPEYRTMVDSLQQWLPKQDHPPYAGNYQRVLEYKEGRPIWQGKPIRPNDGIPGF